MDHLNNDITNDAHEKLSDIQKRYADEDLQQRHEEKSELPEHGLFEGLSLDDVTQRNARAVKPLFQWIEQNPARLIVFTFFVVILTGAILLSLPISAQSQTFTPFLHSLYTATSATCVTGLIIYDTATHWSAFGQFVIIVLIQIGGLSLLTILSAFGIGISKKTGLTATRALQDSTGSDRLLSTFILVKKIVAFTLSAELIGAVILVWRYNHYMSFTEALSKGTFQAISAFCNAGFDLMGNYSGPFTSLTSFNGDPWVLLCTAFLLISGGLGFVVWMDLINYRRSRKLEFHSKLILSMTGGLLVLGSLCFLLLEWNSHAANGTALGDLPAAQRPLAAFFQSAALRTAGFNSIDQASLSDASKTIGSLLMFIGAGPASTGGGIKVSTMAIIVAAVISDLRGHTTEASLVRHSLKPELKQRAFSLFFLSAIIVLGLALLMSLTLPAAQQSSVSFVDLIYESASAFGTVGITSVGSANLSQAAHIGTIITMFLGRVGPATFALSFISRKKNTVKKVLPEAKTFVG